MKEYKVKYIDWLLSVYHFFKPNLKKGMVIDSSMEFQRIAIYSTTALGDFMFNTPAIIALKQRYPNAELLLVSSKKNSQLVENSPWFSRVLYWDNKIRDAYRLSKELKQFRPQLTVILHSYMPYDILCAVLSGTEYIVRDNYRTSDRVLPWLNHYHQYYNGHLIQRKLDLLTQLGCRNDVIDMQVPVDFERAVDDGILKIGFQLGASEMSRCWPVERFVELTERLVAAYPSCQIILLGGARESDLEQQFFALLPSQICQNVVSTVGKTTLLKLLTVIDSFNVLVTGDTGPLHLAVALKKPTVSLYSEAQPEYTGPYQDQELHHILKVELDENKHPRPLSSISADQVFHIVAQILEL
ncbi:glycosyltransferase family 9 protein [Klebsiella sp. BIGb0407]|uniref:glycosyltransferase family 9 protein n=1 Tax=Klebsiella sp. BIGb0407 TaxID=2940603 RepID=UPI0021670FEB|nr:glycosyltransferase family 9 protein [Klebsiella sp. BIGb0407]MCS3434143.1 ADP-heptose:LPS heptosyltransferase [Klebsiella sp. BIGb0407]